MHLRRLAVRVRVWQRKELGLFQSPPEQTDQTIFLPLLSIYNGTSADLRTYEVPLALRVKFASSMTRP